MDPQSFLTGANRDDDLMAKNPDRPSGAGMGGLVGLNLGPKVVDDEPGMDEG